MEGEFYKIFMDNLKTKLQERVKGIVSVSHDDWNIYVSIYRFGHYLNYAIYNLDLMDVDRLNSDKFVTLIISSYKIFINESYFEVPTVRKGNEIQKLM